MASLEEMIQQVLCGEASSININIEEFTDKLLEVIQPVVNLFNSESLERQRQGKSALNSDALIERLVSHFRESLSLNYLDIIQNEFQKQQLTQFFNEKVSDVIQQKYGQNQEACILTNGMASLYFSLTRSPLRDQLDTFPEVTVSKDLDDDPAKSHLEKLISTLSSIAKSFIAKHGVNYSRNDIDSLIPILIPHLSEIDLLTESKIYKDFDKLLELLIFHVGVQDDAMAPAERLEVTASLRLTEHNTVIFSKNLVLLLGLKNALDAVYKQQQEEQEKINFLQKHWNAYSNHLNRVSDTNDPLLEQKKAITQEMITALTGHHLPGDRLAAFKIVFNQGQNEETITASRHVERLALALKISYALLIVPGLILTAALAIHSRKTKGTWNFWRSHGSECYSRTNKILDERHPSSRAHGMGVVIQN